MLDSLLDGRRFIILSHLKFLTHVSTSAPNVSHGTEHSPGMRDITYTVASSVTVVTQFVVSFCIPYLLYAPYANLGSKVGFVFAPLALPTLIFAVLAVPECRGFSLEEIDHLFMQRMPLRKFQTYEHGAVLPQEISEQGTGKMGDEGAYVEEREVATPEGV